MVSANHLQTDGWRDHSEVSRGLGNARLDLKRAEDSNWTLVANSHRDAPTIRWALRVRNSKPRRAASMPRRCNSTPRKTVRQDQLGLIHEHRLAGGERLRLMVYGGQRDTTQFQAIPVATQLNPLHPGGVIGLDRQYGGADLRWIERHAGPGGARTGGRPLVRHAAGAPRKGLQNFIGTTLGVQARCGATRTTNVVSNLDPYRRPFGSSRRAGP